MSKIVFTDTDELLSDCFQTLQPCKRIAVDIETTGLDPLRDRILLLQLYGDQGEETAFVIPVNRVNQSSLRKLIKLVSDKICLIHNAAFEWKFIKTHYGIELNTVYDSKLAESILTAGLDQYRTGLKDVANRYLSLELEKDIRMSFVGVDPETWEPSPEQIEYAAEDVLHLHKIREKQLNKIQIENLLEVIRLEFAVCPVFCKMELAGMLLDIEKHTEVIKKYQEQADTYGGEAIATLTPFWKEAERKQQRDATRIYNSIQEKITAVLEPLGGRLSTKDTPEEIRLEVQTLRKLRDKHKPKPDRDLKLSSRNMVMAALKEAGVEMLDMRAETVREMVEEAPVLVNFEKWIKAQKVLTTYGHSMVDKISPVTGRLHFEYNQIVSTGRSSSSGPNQQNIPKDIRACFKAATGYKLIVADFSNQELRAAAILSGDPVMYKAFEEGVDLHKLTAAMAWPGLFPSWEDVPKDSYHRQAAKTSNFACIYGGSAEALFYKGLIDDIDTAKKVVDTISRTYPTMWAWIHRVGTTALRTGYSLTALGRKRFFETISQQEPEKEEDRREWFKKRNRIKRQAMNLPVQGSCADVTKTAMILIDKKLPAGAKIVGAVHDEIIVEAPEDTIDEVAEIVRESMLKAGDIILPGLPIPADVHITSIWMKE